MTLPDPFVIQMKNLLGTEYADFESALHENPPVSVRLNPFKSTNNLTLHHPVPWCQEGFYLQQRPVFTLDPFFHAGHYYVQEASSMFVDYILKSLKLKPKPKVLDLCSAPGGKSTLILSHLANEGFLHCHEYDPYRVGTLRQNVERWGNPNAVITSGSLNQLLKLDISYDLILIDAPCSGEGMFRKELAASAQWNSKKINHCCGLQKNILGIADALCADDGYIVYSTCTWNMQENEEILHNYVINGNYVPIRIENNYNITENYDSTYTYRMYPHKILGEGYTISVIKKQFSTINSKSYLTHHAKSKRETKIELNQWLENAQDFTSMPFRDKYFCVNSACCAYFENISQKISTTYMGIPLGALKGSYFYPAHGLSQSICLKKDLSHFSMNFEQALEYLKALTPSTQFTSNAQWIIASYESAKLGWLKSSGSGIKNYFPINQRIVSF